MPDLPLAGYGIAITRPADQADSFATLIRAQGGEPILFPLLEISPLEDYAAFDRVTKNLGDYTWAIFISVNAVKYGVSRAIKNGDWPNHLKCVGVGPTTTAALANMGITDVLTPTHRFDSEGLLALPEMQAMAGQRVIIFRGMGGRNLIASTLRARGAEVNYAECYRRRNPQADAGDLPLLWQNKKLQGIVLTSSEALHNLIELASSRGALADWLCTTPIYASHPRISEQARTYGLEAYTASSPDDEAMLQCLLNKAKPVNREQHP